MRRKKKNAKEYQPFVTQMLAHQEDLRAFIYSLLPNSPSADDVLQNTNLVALEKTELLQRGNQFPRLGL